MVREPTTPTEFEIQAHVWAGLREAGINARGEVKSSFSGRACVRFDIAIFESGSLCGIIEIKKSAIVHLTTWEQTRQGARYSQFGVPVRIIYGLEQGNQLIADAKAGKLFR